jgi:hypothetical protein
MHLLRPYSRYQIELFYLFDALLFQHEEFRDELFFLRLNIEDDEEPLSDLLPLTFLDPTADNDNDNISCHTCLPLVPFDPMRTIGKYEK